jgi:hypothetical protein
MVRSQPGFEKPLKIRAGRMAQGEGPEFKPQDMKKKNEITLCCSTQTPPRLPIPYGVSQSASGVVTEPWKHLCSWIPSDTVFPPSDLPDHQLKTAPSKPHFCCFFNINPVSDIYEVLNQYTLNEHHCSQGKSCPTPKVGISYKAQRRAPSFGQVCWVKAQEEKKELARACPRIYR